MRDILRSSGPRPGLLLLTNPGKLHVEVFLVDLRPSQSNRISKSCREGRCGIDFEKRRSTTGSSPVDQARGKLHVEVFHTPHIIDLRINNEARSNASFPMESTPELRYTLNKEAAK